MNHQKLLKSVYLSGSDMKEAPPIMFSIALIFPDDIFAQHICHPCTRKKNKIIIQWQIQRNMCIILTMFPLLSRQTLFQEETRSRYGCSTGSEVFRMLYFISGFFFPFYCKVSSSGLRKSKAFVTNQSNSIKSVFPFLGTYLHVEKKIY